MRAEYELLIRNQAGGIETHRVGECEEAGLIMTLATAVNDITREIATREGSAWTSFTIKISRR